MELAYLNRGGAFEAKGLKAQAIADYEMYLILAPRASDRTTIEQRIRIMHSTRGS